MSVSKKKKVSKKKVKKKVSKKTQFSIQIKKTIKKNSKKKAANNSKWKDEYIPIIKRLIMSNKYDHEIAFILGVSEKTYHNWKNLYISDEDIQSMKDIKKNKCKEAERSLEQLMNGYITREDKVFMTKGGTIKTVKLIKEHPPHMGALSFYLGNRDPDNWKKDPKPEEDTGNDRERKFGFTLSDQAEDL